MQTHTNDTPIELMDAFSMPEMELKIVAGEYRPEFAFDIDKVKRDIGLWLTKAAGLPCGEDHQQPYDFVRMFSMSLSPDMYETHEEFDDVVFLFYIWAFRSHQILKSETFDDAISQIRTMSVEIAYYFGATNKTIRRIELLDALSWIRWFRCTEGCFDLDSGALVDPDKAALREFLATWGHA